MEFNPTPYDFLGGLLNWLLVFGSCLGIVLAVACIISFIVKGARGPKRVGAQVTSGLSEIVGVSWRRVWALTILTFKEAWRRKALMVFVVFALLFMFGGWFLSSSNANADLQVKVYVSFVLTAISWLILPVVLLLACWGIPDDIKARSLHTVVTKPARRIEVVLGRILGFTLIGTLVLSVMGVVGWIWIERQIPESARDRLICRVPVHGQLRFTDRTGNPARKGINVGDIWEYRSYIDGGTKASAIWVFDDITPEQMIDVIESDGAEPVKRMRFESRFEAFRTHKGDIITKVLCQIWLVNDTRERVSWSFKSTDDLRPVGQKIDDGDFAGAASELAKLADGFQKKLIKPTEIEFNRMEFGFEGLADVIDPFSETKPDLAWISQMAASSRSCEDASGASDYEELAKGLTELSSQFRDHADELSEMLVELRVPLPAFQNNEFRENVTLVKRKIRYQAADGSESRTVDLFDDLVHGNQLRVDVFCLDPGQLLGMAQADLFVRTPDRPFASGFFKAVFGNWLKMVLVIMLGVTASCFVKGPVATLLTFSLIVVGEGFREIMEEIISGQMKGSGLIESCIRIIQHMNPQTPLEDSIGGTAVTIVHGIDRVFIGGLQVAHQLVPDFGPFGKMPQYVANGFDVPWNTVMLPSVLVTLAFVLPCILLGYYSLKLRELEAK